jgi:hypothetical protein
MSSVKIGPVTVILCLMALMYCYLYFPFVLADLDEIRYSIGDLYKMLLSSCEFLENGFTESRTLVKLCSYFQYVSSDLEKFRYARCPQKNCRVIVSFVKNRRSERHT